jgi:hypothetical protein
MAALLRKALALGFIFAMSGSPALLAEGGGIESARVRQTTLETLLASRRTLYKARAAYLAQLDVQAHELVAPDQVSSPDSDPPTPERVADLIKKAARRQFIEDERMRTLQGMLELATEIASLQGELKKVKSGLESALQVMDGHWVITFMPSGTRGDFFLTQSGTLLSGDYVLDNGQSGSLVGTFVNNAIFVERIDAKYGKMGRIEGPLSKDHLSVKGTWLNYDPTSGQQITGSFTLDRVQEDREP